MYNYVTYNYMYNMYNYICITSNAQVGQENPMELLVWETKLLYNLVLRKLRILFQ